MSRMNEPITITKADSIDGSQILVALSDGRTLVVTLEQILSTNPNVLPPNEDEESS